MKSPCGPGTMAGPSIIRQLMNDASQNGEQNVLPSWCRRMRPKADWLQKSQCFWLRGWCFDSHMATLLRLRRRTAEWRYSNATAYARHTIPKPKNRTGYL